MKKSVLLMAAVAAMASCTQKEIESPSLTRQVTIVANTADTRTQLSENEVQWEAEDAVKLRFTSSADQSYYITTFNNTSAAAATATFAGTLPNTVSTDNYETVGYAVYPTDAMNADGNVVFTLPAEQKPGTDGSFESGLNLSSAAVSLADLEDKGTASATFKNALSVIRFTVDADVKSVKIEADKELAGQANMSFATSGDDAGRLQVSDFVSGSSSNSVTFTPASGAAFAASTKYNVLVYPGTYSSLKVTLTDTDGCVYTKENSGSFIFAASKFYTFNFATKYVKAYSFTATGRTFTQGDAIATVFSDADGVIFEDELTADASLKFAGQLPKEVVHGESITGFAIYPSTSYDMTQDKVTYTLPSNGTDGAELYSASLSATSTSVAFTSVSDALSTLSFTVPEGVSSVKIVSDKGFVGTAEMTVGTDGKLVSGAGDGKEINLSSVSAQKYDLRIYPVSGATLTFTLTDASGKSVELSPITGVNAAAGAIYTAPLDSDINFEKGGSFDNEDFTEGGTHEF